MTALQPWQCIVAGVSEDLASRIDQLDGTTGARICRKCSKVCKELDDSGTHASTAPRRIVQPRGQGRGEATPDAAAAAVAAAAADAAAAAAAAAAADVAAAAAAAVAAAARAPVVLVAVAAPVDGKRRPHAARPRPRRKRMALPAPCNASEAATLIFARQRKQRRTGVEVAAATASEVLFAYNTKENIKGSIRSQFKANKKRLFVVVRVRRYGKLSPVAALSYTIGRHMASVEGAYTLPAYRQKGYFQLLHDYALDLFRANAMITRSDITARSPWVSRDAKFLGYLRAIGTESWTYNCELTAADNIAERLDRDMPPDDSESEESESESESDNAPPTSVVAVIPAPAQDAAPVPVPVRARVTPSSSMGSIRPSPSRSITPAFVPPAVMNQPPAAERAVEFVEQDKTHDNDCDALDFEYECAPCPTTATAPVQTAKPARATRTSMKRDMDGLNQRNINKYTVIAELKAMTHKFNALKAVSRFEKIPVSNRAKQRQFPAYAKMYLSYAKGDIELAKSHLMGIVDMLDVMEDQQASLASKNYLEQFQDVITGHKGSRSHTRCGGCDKFIPRASYHDIRTCPEVKKQRRLHAAAMLQLVIRLNFTRGTQSHLRKVLGRDCPTHQEFIDERNKVDATIPPLELCSDLRSVRSDVKQTTEWFLKLPQVQRIMELLTHTVFVSFITNDGTPQKDKRGYRPLHPTLIRFGNLGRLAQSLDFTVLLSLHDKSESTATFYDMFVDDVAFRASFCEHFVSTYGFEEHLCLLVADGAAIAHHVNTSGAGGTYGCSHCTRHKDLKHLIARHTTAAHLKELVGVKRSFANIKLWVAELEAATLVELKVTNLEYYMNVCDGDVEEFNRWCEPNLLHRSDHPAVEYIKKYSREHCFNQRGLPTFMHEKFTEDNIIFDALHGLLNTVKAQCLNLLRDIVANNPDVPINKLVDVFRPFRYLAELWLPGDDDEDLSKKENLDGNGCTQLLNNWETIIDGLFGKADVEAVSAADVKNAEWHAATITQNAKYYKLSESAKAEADTLKKKRIKSKVAEACQTEQMKYGLHHMYESQIEDVPADKQPQPVVQEAGGTKRRVAAAEADDVPAQRITKAARVQHQRQQCAKYLMPIGVLLRDAVSLMMLLTVEDGVKYEDCIKLYEETIEKYMKAVCNLTNRNLCVALTDNEAHELINWPLHTMCDHVSAHRSAAPTNTQPTASLRADTIRARCAGARHDEVRVAQV